MLSDPLRGLWSSTTLRKAIRLHIKIIAKKYILI